MKDHILGVVSTVLCVVHFRSGLHILLFTSANPSGNQQRHLAELIAFFSVYLSLLTAVLNETAKDQFYYSRFE